MNNLFVILGKTSSGKDKTINELICKYDFNKIINPFKNPEPGDILYIPIRGKNLEFTHY